jgi:hypothetical protein
MSKTKQGSLFGGPQKVAKNKAQRAARKGVKAGGEAPCTACKSVSFTPARNRFGQFKKR